MTENDEQQNQIVSGVTFFPLNAENSCGLERFVGWNCCIVPEPSFKLTNAHDEDNNLRVSDQGDPEGFRRPRERQSSPQKYHQWQWNRQNACRVDLQVVKFKF